MVTGHAVILHILTGILENDAFGLTFTSLGHMLNRHVSVASVTPAAIFPTDRTLPMMACISNGFTTMAFSFQDVTGAI